MKGKPGTAMTDSERRARNAARMRARPKLPSTVESRAALTARMRIWRETAPGRESTRRAARKSYHANKHKAHWRASKGQPVPLWPEPECCELCGGTNPTKGLALDHSHATGNFRGWLCDPCNTGLGFFRDNPVVLRLAAIYVERMS